jgi:hypothetical protein
MALLPYYVNKVVEHSHLAVGDGIWDQQPYSSIYT